MFQEPALFPWLTAAQNVELRLRLRGVGRRSGASRRRTCCAGAAAGRRRQAAARAVRRHAQRVAMARRLAQDSHVLLMDEPFASLDAITRDVLHEELVRIRESQSLTVVFVTHNVREASAR
jgi:NitT/TauT family transport system ATP-binding protein